MLKKILNLKGVQQLSKKEQSIIHGGDPGTCGYPTQSACASNCPSWPWECVHIFCGPNQGFPDPDGWECVDTSNNQ